MEQEGFFLPFVAFSICEGTSTTTSTAHFLCSGALMSRHATSLRLEPLLFLYAKKTENIH
jgi:hypothetical protein